MRNILWRVVAVLPAIIGLVEGSITLKLTPKVKPSPAGRHSLRSSHARRKENRHDWNYIRKHSHLVQGDASQWLAHQIETYPLVPSDSVFTLKINIADIDYHLNIDTGSSDIWIKGEDSPGQPKVRYQCGQQCIDDNPHQRLGYLDGEVQTYRKQLPVQFGGQTFNEQILVSYKSESNFQEHEGIVGLSYHGLSANPNGTFLQNLKANQIIEHEAFSVNLNFATAINSHITLGGYDKDYYEGDLQIFKIDRHSMHYKLNTDGFRVGNSKLFESPSGIMDTGNTCISLPHKFEKEILEAFNKKDGEKT